MASGYRRLHRHADGQDAEADAAQPSRIDYEDGVERVDGRKIYVWGTSECEGERLGEAEILFIAPKSGLLPR